MKKIGIVTCWVGKLPNFFPLWLRSCAENPTVDWLLFSDQQIDNLPKNVHLHSSSLADIYALIRKNLGTDKAILPHAYKLCDYKVMYGDIFKDYLGEYDFWGYCDIDMIFGDVRSFLTDDLLDSYEKILPLGHLSIYRNTPEFRANYKLPGSVYDWETVVSNPINYAFDEWHGIYRIYKENHLSMYDEMPFADISWLNERFSLRRRRNKKYKAPAPDYHYQLFYWENGKVLRAYLDKNNLVKSDEFLYLHMMKRKFPSLTEEVATANAFYCTPRGFVVKKSGILPQKKDMRKMNPYYGWLYEKIEYKIRRKILKYKNHQTFASSHRTRSG